MGEAVVVFYADFEVACYKGAFDCCGVWAIDGDGLVG